MPGSNGDHVCSPIWRFFIGFKRILVFSQSFRVAYCLALLSCFLWFACITTVVVQVGEYARHDCKFKKKLLLLLL